MGLCHPQTLSLNLDSVYSAPCHPTAQTGRLRLRGPEATSCEAHTQIPTLKGQLTHPILWTDLGRGQEGNKHPLELRLPLGWGIWTSVPTSPRAGNGSPQELSGLEESQAPGPSLPSGHCIPLQEVQPGWVSRAHTSSSKKELPWGPCSVGGVPQASHWPSLQPLPILLTPGSSGVTAPRTSQVLKDRATPQTQGPASWHSCSEPSAQ